MLVLSRRVGEALTLRAPDGSVLCRVVLVRAAHGKARIGVEADRSVEVLRDELLGGGDGRRGAGEKAR